MEREREKKRMSERANEGDLVREGEKNDGPGRLLVETGCDLSRRKT